MSSVGSLLVVTGPPGAGKSTLARALADSIEPSVLVEGDAFFTFLARGRIEPWLSESHAQNTVVTEAAARAAGRFALGFTDEAATRKMHGEFATAGIDRRHVLHDPPRSLEELVDRIWHAASSGTLSYQA